jgi:transcriptional regulator with XRE-family HTH domain
MSPAKALAPPGEAVRAALDRLWADLGTKVRAARTDRGWTIEHLAQAAGSSRWSIYLLERGEPTSVELVLRVFTALGLRLEVTVSDPRHRRRTARGSAEDPVHAAMGEFEAARLRRLGRDVGIDEPYQHYQYSGRADLVSWVRETGALLHLENRTRFPNIQEMAGTWNAKRAYLAESLGARLGVRFRSVTHVLVAAWTSEVLHALRLHPETFRSLAPDPTSAFEGWWSGEPPTRGASSSLIVLDPLATGRQQTWIDLETALGHARARHRGYAELAAALSATLR